MALGAGHAKLILVGEHWVLDGATALAVPLPTLQTVVHLLPSAVPDLQGALADPQPRAMLELALLQAGHRPEVSAWVQSTVPIRRGLGSSAALAVAMVRAARALHDTQPLPLHELVERARALETLVHGRSSGLDPAAAASEGAGVLFCQGEVTGLGQVGAALGAHRWLLADVGQGQPSRQAIELAQQRRAAMAPDRRERLRRQVSQAAQAGAQALTSGDATLLADSLASAAEALQPLGIVDDRMQGALHVLRAGGALAAKPTGAGLGGVVFGLFADQATAERTAATLGQTCRELLVLPLMR